LGYELSGILGFLVLLITIWAIIKIASSAASGLSKGIWIAVVLLLPVIGLIIWFFVGPKG